MNTLRSFRRSLSLLMVTLMLSWQVATPLRAATFYWDTDTSTAGNSIDGTGLGGTGTWDTGTSNWWDTGSLVNWPNAGTDIAIFTGPSVSGAPTLNTVTLSGTITANQLSFLRSGYTLTGGTSLTFAGAGAGLHANLGESATISSLIAGTDGLIKTGGGAIRLASGNTYTGVTSITNGSLVITDQSALGADTSAIIVTEINPVIGSTATLGFVGGALVLDGSVAGFGVSRDLILQGGGPINSRSGAVQSFGNNTLSGLVSMAAGTPATPTTFRNTRIISSQGLLTLSGTLNVGGTAGTTVSSLGGANTAGVGSSYALTGTLTGTGTLEKTGGGTLYLTSALTTGFNGVLRVSGSAASGQSEVRITSNNVLGSRTSGTTGAVLDMNGGVLGVRMDTPLVQATGGSSANVYGRSNSTLFFDHAIGSNTQNGTAAFGNLSYEDNITLTFNSRNGYGASFTTAPVNGGNNGSTITNSMGGLLSFTGNFWSNADNGANRTMTIGGNGNTLINGNINASAAAFNHNLTKTNNGFLAITGTASTLDGTVNVNGGVVAIRDFRSINNNNGVINIGTGGTSANLVIGVDGFAPSAAGLTTSKVINLAGTTGSATIYANQSGTDPVVLNGDFTTSGGSATNSKNLFLGGTNTADNIVNGTIENQAVATTGTVSLQKRGAGTWVLAGENTFTGTTTIVEGTLKLKANGAVSTVLPAANDITFGTANSFGGGTLEFVGQDGVNSVQSLDQLAYTGGGASTIRITPGAGGTASLTFSNIGTGGTATLNIVGGDFTDNKVTITNVNGVAGTNGILTRSIYWNGADYAYREGGVLRAPVYGVDGGTFTSATALGGGNNEITGSFATNSASISTLKINGSQTLTLNPAQTLTISGYGLLATGGASTIGGGVGTSIATATNQPLVVRVDGDTDTLTLDTVITGTTSGITKSGAGTLILSQANTHTGTINHHEGIIRLAPGAVLSGGGTATALNMRQGTVLDLNGVDVLTGIDDLNNNGTVTNTSATPVTFTFGNNNGGGTSFGVITETTGQISVSKLGTGAQSWLGLSNYTGSTTIGSTGLVTVDYLADGGVASGIGASSNAAGNLVFNGTTGGLQYAGSIRNGDLTTGARSASTDRLFTIAGSGATIASSAINFNSIVWSNTGDIAFANAGVKTLTLSGSGQGDNTLRPRITDNGGDATSVSKTGTGIWKLDPAVANTYTGSTTLTSGILMATDGVGLSSASNLRFDGGTLYSQGTLNRNIGTGAGEMQFTAPANANQAEFIGGFLGGDSKLTVSWSGTPVWGSTAGFLSNRDGFILNGSQSRAQGTTGSIALSEVEITGDFSLGTASGLGTTLAITTANSSPTATVTTGNTTGLVVGQSVTGPNIASGAYITSINSATEFTMSANASTATAVNRNIVANTLRPIRVDDNTNAGSDFATISGNISAGDAVTGIRKLGAGNLRLTGANTYQGETNVNQGLLSVMSLGSSGSSGATSVGDQLNANLPASAVTLGNGGTGGAMLQYLGAGETSDRLIQLFSTTGSQQIHADGSGALILTNVLNNHAAGLGNKTLFLRGTNTEGNMVTSVLANNGGTLGVTVDGSAVWILTGANTYTGSTTSSAGALGIGHDAALGGSTLVMSNGNLFAYGADRTISNTANLNNNVSQGFIGDYSLTFTQPLTILAAANNDTINNNVAAGKAVTFSGATANSLTGNRTLTIDGAGTTIFDGDITVANSDPALARGLNITKTGNGVLQLNGTGSNFNRNNRVLDLDGGTLRLGASEVIPDGMDNQTVPVVYGGLTISPEVANGDTATFDLNGFSETVNALTATSNGTLTIDNSAATPSTLTFGAADAAVAIGTGSGTYAISNTGSSTLSISKVGTGTATIGGGTGTTTLSYTGTTSVTGGGTLNILAPLSTTTGVTVDAGSTLSLVGGTGNPLAALTTFSLGAGSGTAILGLELGASNATSDVFTSSGAVTITNTIQFDITGIAGFGSVSSYDLLTAASGLSGGTYSLGNLPGGFTYGLSTSDVLVQLTLSAIAAGDVYWTGDQDGSWTTLTGGTNSNWSTDLAGSTDLAASPGAANTVIFSSSAAVGPSISTTLDNNFFVDSLEFTAAPAGVTDVTIAPGTVTTNTLNIVPVTSTDGINLAASAGNVTISAPVSVGAAQTWHVTDTAGTLTLSGPLQGNANVTITGGTSAGDGVVILSGVADPVLFNTSGTATYTVGSNGTLRLDNGDALGTTLAGNAATVIVNSTGTFYTNSGTPDVAIQLVGGTLSVGNGDRTYEGDIVVSADSFINAREFNSSTLADEGRTISITGVVTGTNSLTLSAEDDGEFNSLDGLVLFDHNVGGVVKNVTSGFSGVLNLNQGEFRYRDMSVAAANFQTTGAINFKEGKVGWDGGLGGDTLAMTARPITIANGATNAVGELNLDRATGETGVFAVSFDSSSPITLGDAAGGTGELRIFLADGADATTGVGNTAISFAGLVTLAQDGVIAVRDNANNVATFSGGITESGGVRNLTIGSGAWGGTGGTVNLTAASTYTGSTRLDNGILRINAADRISAGEIIFDGGAISVSAGGITLANNIEEADTDQIFFQGFNDNNLTLSDSFSIPGARTIRANGDLFNTPGTREVVTFTGAITVATNSDGSKITFEGNTSGGGIIDGGIVSPGGTTADISVSGGEWTFQNNTVTVPDDLTVSTSDAILNLNTAGALTFGSSTNASLRSIGGSTINLGATNAVTVAGFDGLRVGVDGAGVGTFNLNAFNQQVSEFILGNRNFDREGLVNGTGTLTVTANLDLYEGTINANLASTGSTAFEKIGPEIVTLRGDNSGLASTGDTVVHEGTLVFDYTASNTTKVKATEPLDMRGGDLILVGNDSAATTQAVSAILLNSTGGSNSITLNKGTGGDDILLTLGNITRVNSGQDATIRFNLPAGAQTATNGIVTTSPNSLLGTLGNTGTATTDAAYALVNDGTGTFFATANGSGNIVALPSTAKNDVTSWAAGDHVTDATTGFTGTVSVGNINTLRFDAAGGSMVNLAAGGTLLNRSGGILVTDQVTSGTPGIFGGSLFSDVNELIVHQSSAQTFGISSWIGAEQGITKSGTGTLLLTGNNNYNQETEIQEGILQVGGGNAISDVSIVTLAANRNSTLELLADETIGRLQGGRRAGTAGSDYGTVAIGSNTLTVINTSATTYSGFFTGSGTLVKEGSADLNLQNTSTGFTGAIVIESGTLRLSNAATIAASAFTVNKGGALYLDMTSTTRSATRILNTTPITLNSADGTFSASTVVRGLAIRNDQDGTADETVGIVNVNSGASYVGMDTAGANDDSDIIASDIVRFNNATLNVRGTNLGSTLAQNNQFRIVTANDSAFIAANLVGGGGAAASKSISIVPWAIGETYAGGIGAGNMGNSLVTYVSGAGFRPLDLVTEYNTIGAAATTDNARESLGVDLTGLAGTTVNSLVINNTAFAGLDVTGAGAGNSLAVTSGALLFTVTGAAANTPYDTTLSGFDDGITVGGGEYIISVVNPNSSTSLTGGSTARGSTRVTVASTTGLAPGMAVYGQGIPVGATVVAVNSATTFEISMPADIGFSSQTYRYSDNASLAAIIGSPLNSAADITKSGRGTLILSGTNTAGGAANKTTINEGTLEIADLDNIGGDTGGLVFAGGTLRLGTGFTDDVSLRAITILQGGATIDTNGIDLALANSIGAGVGGLTKTGAGNLTLNAAATYTGTTSILGGTLTVGANNAIGVGGDLNVGAGATLDIGTNSITTGLVKTFGTAAPVILGTGTITTSEGFFFTHRSGATVTVNAVLAGPGGVFKQEGGVVELAGANTYTGVTEVQNGTLSFNSIGNVGGGASALGAPTTAENGVIQTGLGGNDPVLTYTGSGHSTDRIIQMNGTGSPGNLTINGNGTGALGLSTIRTTITGTRTLTLGGSSASGIENTVADISEVGGALSVSKTGANTWVLTGANTYTGSTTAGGGVLVAANNQAFGTVGTVTLINTDSILAIADGIDISRPLNVSNTGNNKVLRLQSGATSGTYSGTIANAEATAGNFDVSVDTGGTFTLSGDISGVGGLNKELTGTAILSGTNAYAGTTTVNNGILALSGGSAIFDTGAVVLADTATAILRLDSSETIGSLAGGGVTGGNVDLQSNTLTTGDAGNTTFAGVASGTGALVKEGAGTFRLSGANTYSGATTINTGTLQLGDGGTTGALNTASAISVGSGATFAVNRSNTVTQGTDFDAAPITGDGAFAQSGTGSTILNVANAYTGGTTVSAGTLEVNNTSGSGTGTGSVILSNAGSTLAGSGSIAGSTILGAGTILAPGEATPATSNKVLTFTAASTTAVTVNDGAQIQLGISNEVFNSVGFVAAFDAGSAANALAYLTGGGAGELSSWNAVPGAGDSDFLNLTGAGSNLSLGTGAGTITILDNGYLSSTPVKGDVFNLIDWTQAGVIGGSFNAGTGFVGGGALGDFELPTLGAGLAWDTSAFTTYGVIVIVPEPSRVALLLLGLLGLISRRRRLGC